MYHASELPIVFGNFEKSGTSDELRLSSIIRTAWANFAKDPLGGPGWPAVGSQAEDLAVLDECIPAPGAQPRMIAFEDVDFNCDLYPTTGQS